MKILIIVLAGVIGLIVLLLIIALFTKKKYGVEREIIIHKPKQEVFNYIKYLKNQDNYSRWSMMDPLMQKEYKGTDGTVGFVSAWESDNKQVGKGEQEIKKIIEGERIQTELRFIKPFPTLAQGYFITEEAGADQTRVKWGFTSEMKYPSNVMLLFMNMDKMVGKDFAVGLTNLKLILEKPQA